MDAKKERDIKGSLKKVNERPTFSEATFAFCLVHDLLNALPKVIAKAPTFLTVSEEKGLGPDIKIDLQAFSLFLQFKVSKPGIKAVNEDLRSAGCIPLNDPKFHFDLLSHQYEDLVNLEVIKDYVLYAAPYLITPTELSDSLHMKRVMHDTAFIYPTPAANNSQNTLSLDNNVSIKTFEPKKVGKEISHRICFDRQRAYLFSKPLELHLVTGTDLLQQLMHTNTKKPLRDYLQSLTEKYNLEDKVIANIRQGRDPVTGQLPNKEYAIATARFMVLRNYFLVHHNLLFLIFQNPFSAIG